MSSSRFSFVLYLLSFSTLLSQVVLGVDPLFYTCPSSSGNYTVNGFYGANLNTLMGSLYLKAPPSGFGSGSVGQNPDQANGLALCRGDVNVTDCQACIAEASSEIRKLCPSSKAATVWYENCLLRYSNTDFFGQIDNEIQFTSLNVQNASDPALFNRMTREMLNWLSKQAYVSAKRYAAGELDLGYQLQKLYGLVQCTRDLSGVDCRKCLEGAINVLPSCCDGKIGGRVTGGSCSIRYEIYPFLNSD